MKLHILIPLIGVVFFLACIVVVFFVGQREPVEEVALVVDSPATTTEPVEETAVFTEEDRQASVPANASASAPVCDQGLSDFMADEDAMRQGDISTLSKETVIQAIIRRTDLFKTASARCIRTYVTAGGFAEFARLSDGELVMEARRMAALSDTDDAAGYRESMLKSDVAWTYEGSVMRIRAGGSTQTATFVGGYWY